MTNRKEALTLTTAERNRYKNAIQQMLANPTNPYGKMVAFHGDMSHNMHGGMNAAGTQRFLPWHRDYLLKFEQMLQQIDAAAFVPYWEWTQRRSVPSWLRTFKPTVFIPGRGTVVVRRNSSIPAKIDVTAILALSTFTPFTDQLENGPHGDVHMQVGLVNGVREAMGDIRVSPADPLFWLHHAQLDRLWSIWQTQHPGSGSSKNPNLTGANAVMDPWPERANQLRSIAALGYSYQ